MKNIRIIDCCVLVLLVSIFCSCAAAPPQKCYDTNKYSPKTVNALLKKAEITEEEFCAMSEGLKHLYCHLDPSLINFSDPFEKIHVAGLVFALSAPAPKYKNMEVLLQLSRRTEELVENSAERIAAYTAFERELPSLANASDENLKDFSRRLQSVAADTIKSMGTQK